ncbi:dfa [Symbiodinium sp. KB8]|nr:dfa [Symbiodinium sp. KB8]
MAAEELLEQALRQQQAQYSIQSDLEEAFSYTTGEVQHEYEYVEADASSTLSGDDLEDDSTKGKWLSRLAKVGECVTEITVAEYVPMLPEWMFKKRILKHDPAEKKEKHERYGGIIATVLGFLWPEDSSGEVDIWSLVLNDVEELVNVSILNEELREREADFLSVRSYLTRYSRESTITEKGNDLSIALAKAQDIMNHLTQSTNKYELLPITIVGATLHCVILRERLVHGVRFYGSADPAWLYELQTNVAYYQTFFNYTYSLWRSWRSTLIDQKVYEGSRRRRRRTSDCSSVVTDKLVQIGNDVHVHDGMQGSNNRCVEIANMTAQRILNQVSAAMAKAMQPITYLQRYVPGMEKVAPTILPALEFITVGPYAAVTQDLQDGSTQISSGNWWTINETGFLGPGNIRKASAWAHGCDDVDYFKLTYDDGRSETSKSLSFTEITEGGNCEDLAYPDRYIHTIELHFIDGSDGWAEAQVVNMKLFFSDGYDTGNWYGCFSQCYFYTPSQYTQKVTVTGDSTYKLVGATLGTINLQGFGYINATFQWVQSMAWSNVSRVSSSNNLTTGQRLQAGQALWSYNSLNKLLLSSSGNLATYNMYDKVSWQTKTSCAEGEAYLELQPDGNLVLYCGENNALWASNTDHGEMLCRVAAIENTGALTIYTLPDLKGIWTSRGQVPVGFGNSSLASPQSLEPGQRLVASSLYQFDLAFSDGTAGGAVRLKDWSHGRELWSAGACEASEDSEFKLQDDGNLVLYCSGAAKWDSGTADPSLEKEEGQNLLQLLANGDLVIVSKRSQVTWSSNSKVAYEYFKDDYGIYDQN